MKNLLLFVTSLAVLLTACGDDTETVVTGEPEDVLEVSEVRMTFLKDGESKDIEIISNQAWEITVEDTEWLTASVAEGQGNGIITLTANSYQATEARENLVTVRSQTFTRIIQIRQLASDPMLDVDKTELSYKYAGGTDVLTVTSNTDWEIVIAGEDNWITADSYSGTGDAEVTLTIPLYHGTTDRSAEVILKSGEIEKRIEVSQKFPVTVGVWILSEAGAMQTTADLAYYDAVNNELKKQYYSEVNGETLGQVANHMILYGSKMYISISGEPMGSTSCIRVVDPATGRLLNTIDMKGPHGEGDVSRQMTAHDGKIYVTSYFGGGVGAPGSGYSYYGGVARIDTASMAVEAYARVGDKPEGDGVL